MKLADAEWPILDEWPILYVLDGRVAVPVLSITEWAEWYNEKYRDRHVRDTRFMGWRVSTVFLGVDHSFAGGPPLLFETLVFRKGRVGEDYYCTRCSTWEEAEQMHLVAMRKFFPLWRCLLGYLTFRKWEDIK
jgi:hypothetical protein